jgi:tetratricopeptide (TPR) repeat protein
MSTLDKIEAYLAQNKIDEALRLGLDATRRPKPDEGDFYGLYIAAKRCKKTDVALAAVNNWTNMYQASGIAWHNKASILGDIGLGHQSLLAINKAIEIGLKSSDTILVKARALQSIGDFNKSEECYRSIIKENANHLAALRELSQLIWMRDQDQDGALSIFPSNLTADLAIIKSRLLGFMDRHSEALSTIQIAARSGHGPAMCEYARCLLKLEHDQYAHDWAKAVHETMPHDKNAIDVRIEAASALGFNSEVLELAKSRIIIAPEDQESIALLATAMRLNGDENYRRIYDFEGLVRAYILPCPAGYVSLGSFLQDLKQSILKLHGLKNHPVDQSLRYGSQTPMNLIHWDDPNLKAFYASFGTVVRQYLDDIGNGDDPVRARNHGNYQLHSSWSVRLRSSGFHVDHIHPEGWISSAFYLSVPDEVLDNDKKAGWLKLGQPRFKTRPSLGFESCIKPQEGLLALFPSHMWHGTIPFTQGTDRLTIASDIIPE